MIDIRKKIYLLIAVCIMLGLAACADSPADKTTTAAASEQETEEKPLRIGVCMYRYDDDFMTLYRRELKRYLEDICHAEVMIADGEDSQSIQDKQISNFLQQGYDGLIINPVLASKVSVIADQCKAAGVPVVFINRRSSPSEIKRWSDQEISAAYVGSDEKQSGIYQGEIILNTPDRGDINGDGLISYVMIAGDYGSLAAEYRSTYPIRALEADGLKTERLFEESGNWNRDQGKELAVRALEQYGSRIEVVFCNNDAMANGALEAISEAGRTVGADIYLVGVDALEESVQAVKDGKMTGTVLNDYNTQAHTAADVILKLISGDKTEKEYNIDFIKITAEDKDLLEK